MLMLFLGALMVSFSAVFMELLAVPPTAAAFYRMLFGGVVLLGIVVWRREWLAGGVWFTRPVLLAGLFFALDLVFWHRSILYVGTGLATLLANFQAVLLALASVFLFGERPSWRLVIAVLLAFTGLACLVGVDWTALTAERGLGVALGLLTAVCYACYILALRAARLAELAPSPFVNIALISLLSAGMLAVAVPLQGESFAIPTVRDAGLLVTYGVVGQVLGWVFISRGVTLVSPSRVGLVLLMQPAFAFVWDVMFFGRALTVLQVTGAALALAGIYLGSLKEEPSAQDGERTG